MSIIVTVAVEERKTEFAPGKNCVSISPNGQFCCFLIQRHKPFDIDARTPPPICVKRLQFIDLSNPNKETKVFTFEEESCFMVTSVYWINDKYIVFLTLDGTSFKQIMFKVNLEEEKFITKVCERFYALTNTFFFDWRISNVIQVMFHGESYIVWTDRRQEKGSSTGLYLIPENPMNSKLKLRKFAMFLSNRNPVVEANERIRMKLNLWPEHSPNLEIFGPPLVRNNRLLFCIYEEESYLLFGIFLSVDIEKLIEVKGLNYDPIEIENETRLNYDPIEIENETSAYSMEEWTSLIDREDRIYPCFPRPLQVGKYLLLAEDHSHISDNTFVSIVNIEDLSFSVIFSPMRNVQCILLHPSGFLLTLEVIGKITWTNMKLRISKKTSPWKGSSLKDLARRNIMLNERISQDAKEEYKGVIYQS